MRAIVVILGLALAAGSAPVAAQQHSGVLLHSHASSPMRNVDFGLKQALAVVAPTQLQVQVSRPQHGSVIVSRSQHGQLIVTPAAPLTTSPVDCAMVKTHKHELLTPATPVVTPSAQAKHHLKVITVPACPAR